MKSELYTILIALFAIPFGCKSQQNIIECLDMTSAVKRFNFNELDSSPVDALSPLYLDILNSIEKRNYSSLYLKNNKDVLNTL